MFGSLKKKLQEAVKKVSGNVDKPLEKQEEPLQQQYEPVKTELPKEELVIEEQPVAKELAKEEQLVIEEKSKPLHEKGFAEKLVEEPIIERSTFEEKSILQEKQLPEKTFEDAEKKQKETPTDDYHLIGEEEAEKEVVEEKARRHIIEKGDEIEIQDQPTKLEKTFETAVEKAEEVSASIEEKIEKTEKKGIFGIFKKKKEDDAEAKKVASQERISVVSRLLEKELSESEVEKILKELEIAMLENDVAVEVVEKISASIKKQLVGSRARRGDAEEVITQALRNAMIEVMQQKKIDMRGIIESSSKPLLVMMLGFNGVGKTTTLAKIANKFREYKPILAAGDTFRAASIEQLEEHSRRLNAKLIKSKYGADSAAVIFDAVKHAAATGTKLVLADTAGRSHTNINLMDELRKVVRVNNPDLKVLVLDSLAGNDIYEQARLFDEAVGVDAIILTKSDVYDRGGAALSAAYALKKPILFLGTGQEYEDLMEFDPEIIVKNLLE